jgi:hypothetical protein
MYDIWQRVIGNLVGRLDGPFHFRFIVQPMMAVILATIGGVKDARLGKPTYLWAVVSNPEHRKEFLRDGWKNAGRIFILAILLEMIYQPYVLHAFYPGEMLIVAFLLAIVPYVLVRGPVNRIIRLLHKTAPEVHSASRGRWAA